jgi:hypothetical protein
LSASASNGRYAHYPVLDIIANPVPVKLELQLDRSPALAAAE